MLCQIILLESHVQYFLSVHKTYIYSFATFPTYMKLSFSGESKTGIHGMLLRFASAGVMNYMTDHAKGAHELKRDRAWFRWAMLRLKTPAHSCTGCRNAAVPGLPKMVQNLSPDPPTLRAPMPGQALTDTCRPPGIASRLELHNVGEAL